MDRFDAADDGCMATSTDTSYLDSLRAARARVLTSLESANPVRELEIRGRRVAYSDPLQLLQWLDAAISKEENRLCALEGRAGS